MSRIGRAPIPIPDGVTVDITGQKVTVKGPRGELSHTVVEPIRIAEEDGRLVVTRPTDRGPHRALHGLSRSLVANLVTGVSAGFERRLEIQGVAQAEREKRAKAFVKKLGWKGPWFTVSAISGDGTRELCFAIMEFLEGARAP